jgi:hypothetical protein
MSQQHSDTVKEDNANPLQLAIAVTIGAIALVVGIVMLAYFAVGTHQVGEADSKANSAEAVALRIAPATVLVTDPTKGAAPAATAVAVPKSGNGPS